MMPRNVARFLWLVVFSLVGLPRFAGAGTDAAGPADGALTDEHFLALAAQAPLRSEFVEKRFFSFRKTPVVLHGEMRFAPDLGLSLRYLEPRERIMIIDREGVLLRDDRGRSREIPRDPRRPSADSVLLPILGFDLPTLRERFEIDMKGSPEAWSLTFIPRDDELRREVGEVVVDGQGLAVTDLEFTRSKSQRVEIAVEDTVSQVNFLPDEVERFFR